MSETTKPVENAVTPEDQQRLEAQAKAAAPKAKKHEEKDEKAEKKAAEKEEKR